MLRIESPHLRAFCKDSTTWFLPTHERASFEGAWTTGKAFWWGVDLWDQPIVVKLADVVGLIVKTADALALIAAEAVEVRQRGVME